MDFSGYSRIARGVAKLFGIELMVNFNYPYKARSFGEFWSRWHISLSTWFRDYLYIPLGGNRKGSLKTILNLGIVFTISGLWHGAAWNFVLWGVLHFVMLAIERSVKIRQTKITDYLLWFKTLVLVNVSWIFFRAPSFDEALIFISKLFEPHQFIGINSLTFQSPIALVINTGLILGLPLFLRVERKFNHLGVYAQNSILITSIVLMTILQFSSEKSFIYFQF
jgi:alginate O-acetyltransferase complex protein AlgI